MKAVKPALLSLALLLASAMYLSAQEYTFTCRYFKKKGCKHTELGDYSSNGQAMVAPLVPGEEAELSLTFYRGHDYRVMICGEEHLGPLEFKIKDSSGAELFNNKNFEMTQDWDFSMSSTKRLIVVVGASGKTTTGQAAEEGCVSLVVGNRKTPKTGFY